MKDGTVLTPQVVKTVAERTNCLNKAVKAILDCFGDLVQETCVENQSELRYSKIGTFIPRPSRPPNPVTMVRYRPPRPKHLEVARLAAEPGDDE